MYRQREKNLLSKNTSSTCPRNIVSFGPLTAEICWRVGYPSKFQRVSRFGFVTATTSLTVANQTLHDLWPSPGLVHCIYIFGGSCPHPSDGILPRAKFTLPPSLAFSYIGSVTARHSAAGVAKLRRGTRNGILWNFCRGRHIYSAWRPSPWTSAHILVFFSFLA